MLPRFTLGLFAFAGWISYSATTRPDANVSTDDVHRFVDALHQIAPTDSTCAPFDAYFHQGSDGLKAYSSKFSVGRKELCAALKRSPDRYAAIEPKLSALDSAGVRIDSIFTKFKTLVPDSKTRPVYFVVGNGISGGTTTHGFHPLVLVGVELMGNPHGVPGTVAHEFVHTLQDYPWIGALQSGPSFLCGTVLRHSIMEGSASFIADLVTESHSHNLWAEAHERELWTDFQRDLHSKDYGLWLYNGRDKRRGERPADLGYWMGYQIVESYYNRASDKARAIHEILTIKDFDRFFRESGYNGPA
jgi:hypothetical protein